MSLKQKLVLTMGSLIGTIGTALAEPVNMSLTPDTEQGMENLSTLPYVDKLVWVRDTVYALVPYIAYIALGILALKFYFGGWESVENELRQRKAFFTIIGIVLALKVGSACIGFITAW